MSQQTLRLSDIPASALLGVLLDIDDLWAEFSAFGPIPAGSVRIRLPYKRPLDLGGGEWALEAPGAFTPLNPPEWHSPSEVRSPEDAKLIAAFEQKVTSAVGKNAFEDLRLTIEDLVLEGRPFFIAPRFLSYSPGEILESKMCTMFSAFSRAQDRTAMAAGHDTPVFRTDPFRVARIYFRALVQQTRAMHQTESRAGIEATLGRLGVRLDWAARPDAVPASAQPTAANRTVCPRP